MYRDFLTSELEAKQRTSQELVDLEYAAILNRSDSRVLMERGGRVPPNPFAPKEPPVPGSEAEYDMLLDKLDPRINMRKRR